MYNSYISGFVLFPVGDMGLLAVANGMANNKKFVDERAKALFGRSVDEKIIILDIRYVPLCFDSAVRRLDESEHDWKRFPVRVIFMRCNFFSKN